MVSSVVEQATLGSSLSNGSYYFAFSLFTLLFTLWGLSYGELLA